MHDVVLGLLVAEVGERGANVNLDALCHAFADAHVVLAAHIFLNVGGEVVAGHLDGVVRHDAAERNHGNLRRAAADVNHHVALRRIHVEADTDGSRHGFVKEEHVAAAGMLGRVAHGTQLYFGRAGGHADNHAQRRREEAMSFVYFLNKSAQHLLAGIEVGNHAVAQGTNHADAVVRLFVHQLSAVAHGNHLFRMLVERNDRRLVDSDAAVGDDDRVGCAEVDGQFLRERK